MENKPKNNWEEEFDKMTSDAVWASTFWGEEIKDFIRATIAKERQEEREKIVERIAKDFDEAVIFGGIEFKGTAKYIRKTYKKDL